MPLKFLKSGGKKTGSSEIAGVEFDFWPGRE
jgi:hypothetical protein